ncbi:MAG: hypothetical protein IJB73_01095 [Firmicutes bacterium]|nr:hypothetical protein [Bacillota bacterium]
MKKAIADLYLENISNTEFIREPEVMEYMEKVNIFLREYFPLYNPREWRYIEEYDEDGLLVVWQEYIVKTVYEVYNSFLYGNFMCAISMTRTLIESYVYYSILKKEQNPNLILEWFFSNHLNSVRYMNGKFKHKMKAIHEMFCDLKGIDSEETWQRYIKADDHENEWLKTLKMKKTTFSVCCEYIEEKQIYKDYREAGNFVHAQSIVTKLEPFTFYETIFSKMTLMMIYIFKALRLFNQSEETELAIQELEMELFKLNNVFL